jgi:hypothetical protein
MLEQGPHPTVERSPWNKSFEFLVKIAMAVFSPLLLIGLFEGVAYFWEQGQARGPFAWELVASRRLDWVAYGDASAGYTLMKPGAHYEWQNIPVDINSRGLRDSESSYEKPADTVRILNLGDSIAMGWGVSQGDTYAQKLEESLNSQETGNRRYEVINAGVPGWNLENALAYLQAEGLKYDPDLILLEITIVNDIYGDSALDESNRPALIEWLRTHTYFWPFLTIQMRWAEARFQKKERIPVLDPPKEAAFYFPLDASSDQWTKVWDLIVAMNRLAQAHNIRFGLILFPLEYQVLDEDYSILPQKILNQKATEAEIPVLDLLPIYQQACREKPGGGCFFEDRYLFADVWMHPSLYGHELAAKEIEAYLVQIE